MTLLRHLQTIVGAVWLAACPASSQDMPAHPIADSLLQGAHSVVRDYRVEFRQRDAHNGEARFSRTVTVLHPDGRMGAGFAYPSNRFQKLKDFKGFLYDAEGKLVDKLRQSDLEEDTFTEGLASDFRIHFCQCPPLPCPFTIRYEWTCTYRHGLITYPDFHPQNDWQQAVEHASYRLSLPSSVRLMYRTQPAGETPHTSSSPQENIYRWEVSGLRALPPDKTPYGEWPHVYAQPEEFACEDFEGRQDTWKSFGQWLWKLLQGRDNLPPEEVARVQELTRNAPSTSDKVRMLYDYLAQHTRYVSIQLGIGGWQPIAAEQVSRTKFGDCKGLTNYLKSMLKAVGIPSIYTVISTEKAHISDFPGVHQMNHVVLCVPLRPDTLWLECTNARLPFGYVHSHIAGHDALLVTPDGGQMVCLPDYPPQEQKQSVHACLTVSTDGQADGTVDSRHHLAFYEKNIPLLEMDNKKLMQKLASGIGCTQVSLSDIRLSENKQPLPSLACSYHMACQYARHSAGRLFVPLNPFRKHTLPQQPNLPESYVLSDTIDLKLPAGCTVEHLPAPVGESHTFGEFSSKAEVQAGRLRVCQHLLVRKGEYGPSARPAWEAFRQKVVQTCEEPLILLLHTGPASVE